MREMRIWPQYAAKCCKNAGKFFPNKGNTNTRFLLLSWQILYNYI